MKKSKVIRIMIVLAVFIVLLTAYLILKNNNKEEVLTEETEESTEVLSVSTDEIAALTFMISEEEVSFKKEEDSWTMESDQEFPVDEDQMSVLTDALSAITAGRVLEDIQDLEEYGLTDPQNIIKISKTDGSEETITVGDTNESTGYCYIYLNDEKDIVYAVDGDLSTVFAGSLLNYAEQTTYPAITASDISKISVEMQEDSYQLRSSEVSSTGWELIGQDGVVKEAESENISTLQSAIAGFSFARYYDYRCEDMNEYGLEEPYAVITAKYMVQVQSEEADNDEDESEIEQVEEEIKIYIGDEDEDGNRYIRINDSMEVHAIASDSLNSVLDGKGSNYENTMVTNVLMSDLERIDITVDGERHSLYTETVETEDEETETTYSLDGKEMESSDYISLYSKITALSWQEKLEEEVELSEEADLTILFKLTDETKVQISCYPYDSNFYIVQVDDGEQLLVNKMKVKDIIDSTKEIFGK